jgi:ketosteroid isomerase-like protein
MHPNAQLLQKLYNSLNNHDYASMAACYRADAVFEDIAFRLSGKQSIQAMWHMISEGDLRATFSQVEANDENGVVKDLVDTYTFRDTGRHVVNRIRSEFEFREGLIQSHRDHCNPLQWGLQALGPVKGLVAGLVPRVRQSAAQEKLANFMRTKPEYISIAGR